MITIRFIFYFLSVFIGCFLGHKRAREPVKIEFRPTILDWTFLSNAMFSVILLAFPGEIAISNLLVDYSKKNGSNFIISIVDAGVMVIVFKLIIFAIYKYLITSSDLDINKEFDEMTFKIYFTVYIMVNVVLYSLGDEVPHIIYNRIILWILAVVDLWIGTDYFCGGRINRDKKKIKHTISEDRDAKKKYWLTIVLSIIIVFAIVPVVLFFRNSEIYDVIIRELLLNCTIMLSSMIMMMRIHIPSKFISEKRMYYNISTYIREGKCKLSGYRSIKYQMQEGKLLVYNREIIYPGHDEEIKELKMEYVINSKVDESEVEKIAGIIRKQYEKQRLYIQESNEECKNKARKEALQLVKD